MQWCALAEHHNIPSVFLLLWSNLTVTRPRWFPFLAAVCSALAGVLPLSAQGELPGALVVRLGLDTLSIERWTRTADRMEGDYLRRLPAASQWHYVITLDPKGLPRELALTPVRAGRLAIFNGLKRLTLQWDGDSVTILSLRDTLVRRRRAAINGMPIFPDSYAFFELWMSWLRRSGQDSATVAFIAPLGGPAGAMQIRSRGDSAQVMAFGSPIRMRTDDQGRLLGLDATATTIKHTAERVASVDLDKVFAAFAKRDSLEGEPGTFISHRDTVRATVGGAQLWIDYGRPAKRGRAVFAKGVLGDTLWRTGANAATQFRTDRDLQFGDRTLPAGIYTLWTHIATSGAELIFNGQSGQWGTEYHPERDVLRVPLEAQRHGGAPVELFTIATAQESGASTGVLRFTWDDAEWRVRFATR